MADLMVFIHFVALAMGGAASIGLLVVGLTNAKVPPEHRPSVGRVALTLRTVGKTGMALLLLTGIIMATAGGVWGDASPLFWVKLVAVAALIVGIVMGIKAGDQAMKGDPEAAKRAMMIAKINLGLLAVILACAVVAFD